METRIIAAEDENMKEAVAAATDLLDRGEVVAVPTETVYGLGADATNAAAVAKVFEIKERPAFDPLIVHIASVKDLEQVATVPPKIDRVVQKLISAFWPEYKLPVPLILNCHTGREEAESLAMRRRRLLAPEWMDCAYYHCCSRVVDRRFIFGPAEKDHFRRLMRMYEKFCGLRIISYCLMTNHFHILVEVPRRPAEADLPDDAGLVSLVRASLGDKQADALEWQLSHHRAQGAEAWAEALREQWFARMWSVSQFMKVLKQRFTQWFNGRNERRGTLWEERFHSVLVEGECRALQAMAAYIDLNPVRAGICEDPKDYRWCGYAEAVAGVGSGGGLARRALAWLVGLDPHGGPRETEVGEKEGLVRWRCELFGIPESERGRAEELAKGGDGAVLSKKRIPRAKALEVLASGGRLSQADYLRCRVRYLTAGVAIGTKDFVERIFRERREWFSAERQTGARRLRGLELRKKPERLYALRQLQKDAVG